MPVVLPLTLGIDALTLGYKILREKLLHGPNVSQLPGPYSTVSVVIPTYNEEANIGKTIECLFAQSINTSVWDGPRLLNVTVIDDCSTDRTDEICRSLEKEFPSSIHYIRKDQNTGKAASINFVAQLDHIGDYLYVADGDSRPAPDCLERLLERFTDEDVGAVTSYGLTLPPKSLIARWFHWGMAWNNDIFSFRKQAQAYRRAVAVVCGSSTMYRTRVLRVHPIPERTKAEDTDHTWVLQEHGYRVDFAINSISFDDELETAMAEFRQWDRWYSGTYQSLAVHNKELLKAKSLFWSTIVPSTAEAIPYAVAVALVPLLFLIEAAPQTDVPLISLSHIYGAIFIDFLWTLIPTALIKPKHLLHLPQIYTFKLIGGFITTRAFIRTGIEALLGRHASWRNRWVT